MAQRKGKAAGITATASTPEGELKKHLAELGLESVEAYRVWLREHGLGSAIHKDWQARRREQQIAEKEAKAKQSGAELAKHWQSLGLASQAEYETWCIRHGFGTGQNKNAMQRRQEQAARERERSEAAMARARTRRLRPQETLQRIHDGQTDLEELKTPALAKAAQLFYAVRDVPTTSKTFLTLLLHIHRVGNLFHVEPVIPDFGADAGNTYLDGMLALARCQPDWIRPLDAWKPDSKNARRQFGSLARHLLARYDVPIFMDAAWFGPENADTRRQQEWFRHVGQGQNIRTAELPLKLTKRAAHLFLSAPAAFTIPAALRWSQIRAMDGDEYLARAVLATRLGETFGDEEFWEAVLFFFVNNPMLDTVQIGPIVDYLAHQRETYWQAVQAAGGPVAPDGRRIPEFTMKGRMVPALLERVEAWHQTLAREPRTPTALRVWEPSGIGGFACEEPDEHSGLPTRWVIRELLTGLELTEEGKTMRHCVFSYAASCARGQKSVWSVRAQDIATLGVRPLLTVEVHNNKRLIVQARGRCNKMAGERRASPRLEQARAMMMRWATQEHLSVIGSI